MILDFPHSINPIPIQPNRQFRVAQGVSSKTKRARLKHGEKRDQTKESKERKLKRKKKA
jgi:hypothetical protein